MIWSAKLFNIVIPVKTGIQTFIVRSLNKGMIIMSPIILFTNALAINEGFNEQHPFDTSINDEMSVAVEIKVPKIEYLIAFPKDKTENLEIFVAGYMTNR